MLNKSFTAFCLLLIWIVLAVAPAFAHEDPECQMCTRNHCPAKKVQMPACHHTQSSQAAMKSASCPCKNQAPLFTYVGIIPLFDRDLREVVTNFPEMFLIPCLVSDLQSDTPPPKEIVNS